MPRTSPKLVAHVLQKPCLNLALGDDGHNLLAHRGPAAILFTSRDTCSDSIAKVFRACFHGVSHNYRAIRCKMEYRTDVPV